MKTKNLISSLIVTALLALTGCDYYVPITAVPSSAPGIQTSTTLRS